MPRRFSSRPARWRWTSVRSARSAPLLITAGSLVMVAIFVVVWRRQPSLFMATMTVGALAWTCGNAQWLAGAAIYRVVFWWLAFLVLTIAGERLELNRVLRPTRGVRGAFVVAVATCSAASSRRGGGRSRASALMGAGLVGVDLLARALRRGAADGPSARADAVHGRQPSRRLRVAGFGGAIAAVTGAAMPGCSTTRCSMPSSSGSSMSMVFAHAPIIFPAVLGLPLAYRPSFYLHVGVLHLSLIVRVAGDLDDELGRWRGWGGLFNALALLLFMINTGRSMALGGMRGESI